MCVRGCVREDEPAMESLEKASREMEACSVSALRIKNSHL